MLTTQFVVAFFAAVVAGAINSAAGGGTFLSFPTLLILGISPIYANATNNTAMWVGNLGSISGFREDFVLDKFTLLAPAAIGIGGAVIGSLLLLHTSEIAFVHAVPYLLGFATIVFAFGPLMRRRMSGAPLQPTTANVTVLVTTFFVAVYGGYFGAGIGIMLLALYAATTAMTIPRMNAHKNLLAFFINGASVIPFALAHVVIWPIAAIMSGGAVIGAYFGARIIRRLPPNVTRGIVIAIGVCMTTYFFVRQT